MAYGPRAFSHEVKAMDPNRITKLPALNPTKVPDDKREPSMALDGYERLDGGPRKRDASPFSPDREGMSETVYPRTRVYDDH